MQNKQPALRIFACMKTRTDGRASCGAGGSSEIMMALRQELRARGISAAHIDVRPSGCLKRCEEGPVLLGFTGPIAEEAIPPHKLDGHLLKLPDVSFERVTTGQIPTIVDQLLGIKQ